MEEDRQPKRKRGAQPGNLNALYHGGRSEQYRALIERLQQDPEVVRLAQALARTRGSARGLLDDVMETEWE